MSIGPPGSARLGFVGRGRWRRASRPQNVECRRSRLASWHWHCRAWLSGRPGRRQSSGRRSGCRGVVSCDDVTTERRGRARGTLQRYKDGGLPPRSARGSEAPPCRGQTNDRTEAPGRPLPSFTIHVRPDAGERYSYRSGIKDDPPAFVWLRVVGPRNKDLSSNPTRSATIASPFWLQ
jgi:hypothetical protein